MTQRKTNQRSQTSSSSSLNIESMLDEMVLPLRSKGFEFRPFQRETILSIADACINRPERPLLIDAPTGTGKSIISMFSSMLLNSIGKRGYILTSDLGLQAQYDRDIASFGFKIPSVSGLDNYECLVNHMPISLGECRTKKGNLHSLPCYSDCAYFSRRDDASSAKTCLLNYSYWLLQLNYVMRDGDSSAPFTERDFCFFDEAHRIQDIVQSHFSPRLGPWLLDTISEFSTSYRREVGKLTNVLPACEEHVRAAIISPDNSAVLKSLSNLAGSLNTIIKESEMTMKNKFTKMWPFGESVPGHVQKMQRQIDRISDVRCKLEDFVLYTENPSHLVRVTDSREEECASFKNINESALIRKTLLEKSRFKVFMSATLGRAEHYARSMGIDDYEYINIDNQFDHSRSPIIYVRGYKMNYAQKQKNLPRVVELCDAILEKHKEEKGIIHSASFALTQDIARMSKHSKRLITYASSSEKSHALSRFADSDNGVLIGPSLLEGLSFDDDASRFQVVFKVPFPNVSDEFMKRLLEMYPERYMMKTANSIVQGIGRSVRSKDDWAVTYVLDECFDSIVNGGYLPEAILNRMKIRRVA